MDKLVQILNEINNSLIEINKSLNKPKKIDYMMIIMWVIVGAEALLIIYYVYYVMSPLFTDYLPIKK